MKWDGKSHFHNRPGKTVWQKVSTPPPFLRVEFVGAIMAWACQKPGQWGGVGGGEGRGGWVRGERWGHLFSPKHRKMNLSNLTLAQTHTHTDNTHTPTHTHVCAHTHMHTAEDTHRCKVAQIALSLRGADSEHIMQTEALCVRHQACQCVGERN